MKNLRIIHFVIFLLTAMAANATLLDSIYIEKDIVEIEVADDGRYAMLKSGEPSFWNGKFRLDLVSLETGEKIWKKNWTPGNPTLFTDRGVLIAEGKQMKLYDIASGKEILKYKGKYVWHDLFKNIIVGFTGGNKITGYNIHTGEKIWETKSNNDDEMQWTEVCRPNSTHLVYHSDVIGMIDFTTGEHNSYPLKRRISDNGGNAAKIGMAVLLGVVGVALTGVAYVPFTRLSKYELLGSNVVCDSIGNYYVADRDILVCLDKELNEKWKICLPKSTGSYSRLYLRGDSLDFINHGIGSLNCEVRKVGKPFFGTLDMATGENQSFHMLPEKWEEELLGKNYLRFLPDSVYYYHDSKEKFIMIEHNPKAYPISTQTAEVVMIDKDINYGDVWLLDGLYVKVREENDGTLMRQLAGPPEYLKIDAEGKVTELWDPSVSLLIDSNAGTFVFKGDYLYSPAFGSEFSIAIGTHED